MIKNIKSKAITKKNNSFFFLFFFLIIFYALFFPPLESPDEIEQLNRILSEKSLWGEVTKYLADIFIDVRYLDFSEGVVRTTGFEYLRNTFLFLPFDAPKEYYLLRLINCLFIFLFFILIVKIFNGNKMTIMWPSATYYMSLITPEALAYALMLGSSTNTKFKILVLLSISVLLSYIDRSIYVFIAFLFIKLMVIFLSRNNINMFLNYSKVIFIISISIYLFTIINYSIILDLIIGTEAGRIMNYSQHLNPSHINQLLIFISTFFILSGSLAFYPTIIFYGFISCLLISAFKHSIDIKSERPEINEILGTFLIGMSVFFLVSSIAPQLSHFRYYLFLVPAVVSIFFLRYSVKSLFLLSLLSMLYNTLGINLLNNL